MRLAYPIVLLAGLPVLLALLMIARRGSLQSRRPGASFAVRFLILLALATALSAPSIAARPQGPSVVFALDVSDSVSDESLEKAVDAIREASKSVSARGGVSSLVLFAGRATVARDPSSQPIEFDAALRRRIFSRRAAREAASEDRPSAAQDELDPLKTRATSALLLAGRLHRAGGGSRTVLITDGVETDPGSAPPIGSDVRIVRLPDQRPSDTALRGLRAPLAVRAGEAFDVEVDAWADKDTEAKLALMLDGQVVAEDSAPRLVRAGRSTLRIRSVQNALPQGLHRLQAVLSAERDVELRNNAAAASFNVVGKTRVLVLEGTPAEGEGLSRLLTAQGIEFERKPLEMLAAGGVELDRWAVVVIVGAAPAMVPVPAAKVLATWLEDGGGLLFAGSSTPAGEGAYDRPEFTQILPVDLEAPKAPPKPEGTPGPPGPAPPPSGPAPSPETRKVLAPSIALLLLIDKSGSMAGDPITLCKEAAIASLETLSEKDFLGVLAFDRQPVWLQRFEAAHRTELIRRNILQLFADGGTDLMPALEEASRAFKNQEAARSAGVKHIILLSDGDTPVHEYEKVVRRLSDEGVVVTSVCVVGPGGFKDQLMRNISRWGKGRYFFADSFQKVPRIFTEETRIIVKDAAARTEPETSTPPPPPTSPPTNTPEPPRPSDASPPSPASPMSPGASGKVIFKDEHEVIRGIAREPAPPPLTGALAGKARRTSYVPLAFEDGGPTLALWRYGLGRSAVWMSDVGGPWSAGWDKWNGTTKLFVQIVRHLSNAAEDVGLASAVRVERHGSQLEFRVDNDVTVHELAPNRRELQPVPDPEGLRRFVLPVDGTAIRQVSIGRVTEGKTESFTLEFAASTPAEIAAPPDAPAPFAWTSEAPAPLERLTQESMPASASESESRVPIAAIFVLLALLLVPIDVIIRRWI